MKRLIKRIKQYTLTKTSRLKVSWDWWVSSDHYCPRQVEKKYILNGKDYIIYLRWRWSDPYQVYVIIQETERLIPVDCGWYSMTEEKDLKKYIDRNILYIIERAIELDKSNPEPELNPAAEPTSENLLFNALKNDAKG